jgi:adenylate kinase
MRKDLNIILFGAPGAGKGTLAERLVEELGLIHISTGDIFRREIADKTELGKKISAIVKGGGLVPDELVTDVVTGSIKNADKGFLFDGFPRTLPQAEGLDKFFAHTDRKITAVVFIDLNEEEILRRLSLRRTCENCKIVYNLVSKSSKKENICDKCGGKLILREDDKIETVRERLKVFYRQTAPVIDYYKKNPGFYKVEGMGSPQEVCSRVLKTLGVDA